MTKTVALLVTAELRDAVTNDLNALTPDYTVGFTVGVCTPDVNATWQTPATHWYTNGEGVPDDVAAVWQEYATNQTLLKVWTAVNSSDPYAWAKNNVGSEGLQFVPSAPL